ncbi:hypothetical protein BDW75DRAFT_246837 [Aspergillus navahoensis]
MTTLTSKRAADLMRQIRCDKSSPCSNCRLSGATCITKLAARPKQARSLTAMISERKIDLIENRLDRLGDLVESLVLQLRRGPPSQPAIQHTPKRLSTSTASVHDCSSRQVHGFPTPNGPAEKCRVVKGQSSSSLSAQSSFAVRFLHDVVDSKQERDIPGEVTCLLETISQLVETFNHQSLASTSLFPHARAEQTANLPRHDLPPIEVAVNILREAQEADNVDLHLLAESFQKFLSPQSLSDLCLKVYFAPEYSAAEFIIINAALYFFGSRVGVTHQQPSIAPSNVSEILVSACRANLETALSQLALYIQPSHEIVFALVLGPSTILDSDVTVSMPSRLPGSSSSSHLMEYFGSMVKLARLAGRIYEELYCAGSLSLPVDERRHRATEPWLRSAAPGQIQMIKSTAMSDDVLRQSMLTLIYRAMPVQAGSSSTFNEECLETARAALEDHQSFILEFGMTDTVLLYGHFAWSILFVPFVPFIVLFCHVIETGDLQDLNKMQGFVTSMESACPHSPAIAKHHHLFQVFCTVAQRYRDIMAAASSREEQLRLRMEMDAQLCAFGLQSQLAAGTSDPGRDVSVPDERMPLSGPDIDCPGVGIGVQNVDVMEGFNLGDWFSFSQNIVGLLDRDNLLF